jgi:hypothetical protein
MNTETKIPFSEILTNVQSLWKVKIKFPMLLAITHCIHPFTHKNYASVKIESMAKEEKNVINYFIISCQKAGEHK